MSLPTTTAGTSRTLSSALKSALEIVALLAVCAASITVIVSTVAGRQEPPEVRQVADGPRVSPPDVPHVLAGAALLGDQRARVAIVEYSDFECPFCGEFATRTWPELKKRYVDTGRVLLAFRHLPLTGHRYARPAAMAANCAAQQGKFWEMHHQLFARQATLSLATPAAIAGELGLDIPRFQNCAEVRVDDLTADRKYAEAAGIRGTPTFLVGLTRANQTVEVKHILVGVQPLDRLARVVDELLAGRREDRESQTARTARRAE